MRLFSWLHLFSLLFCYQFFSCIFSRQYLCHPDERSSLLQFKNSFFLHTSKHNYAHIILSWDDKSKDCCTWYGITCQKLTGHVIGLNLGDCGLQGNIYSNSSLFSLGHLQSLDLSHNDFRGSPISPKFGGFVSMTHLDLSYSNFSGSIPESIFHLANLQLLDLGYNDAITGYLPMSNWSSPLDILDLSLTRIPIDWNQLTRNLKSLRSLSLRNCRFVGSYPTFLGNLTQIISLDLSYNGFGGQMPWSFLTLGRLLDLDLSGNNFVGQFSQVDYSNSSHWNLTFLKLYENSLNGTIPSWLYSLPRLESLELEKNQLSGNIMEFQSTSLKTLDLSSNMLHGQIPSSIFKQVNLQFLYLQSNNLSGSVEFFANFSKLQSLVFLDLSFNRLSLSFNNSSSNINSLPRLRNLALSACNISEFPNFSGSTFPQLQMLRYLNLSHNLLTGIEQFPWTNLNYLDLRSNLLQGVLPVPPHSTTIFIISNNKLTGGIPLTICNLSSLQVLDLSNNKLSGKIPPCMGNFSQSLSVLDLKKNKFVGTIPETFSRGNAMRNLDLNGNQLEGPLPQSLFNCRKLEVLDLGNNKINGTFPFWLETLPMLQVLVLRSNRLHGAIGNPSSSFPFQKLRIMDLSHNQFSGLLPRKYLDKLKGMINVREDELKYMGERFYQDTVTVVIKGCSFQLEKIQTMFTTIDLSDNLFKGEIPDAIGKLNSLKGLNLSHNQLTGWIPPSFCNLTKIESLDLSSNRLVGKIPGKLTDLTSLSKLNLSENQLVGSIPRGPQFNTFDNDSYRGNVDLCGFPLTKKCDNEEEQEDEDSAQEDQDSEYVSGIFDWRAVLMGCGCGVVIGVSLGYMVSSSRKVDRVVEGVGRELRCKLMKTSRRSSRKRV